MARVDDTPAGLKAAMDVAVHIEIAENKKRTAPDIQSDDFRPFFRILRDTRYRGAISIEESWTEAQLSPSSSEIAKRAIEA